MRRCGKTPNFVEQDGLLLGVFLPADFCAEHEWGIERLQSKFGIEKHPITLGPMGLERRAATKCPDQLHYSERKDLGALAVGRITYKPEPVDLLDHLPMELSLRKDTPIAGAWDESSFGVLVQGKEELRKLREVRDAVQHKDVLVFIGGQVLPAFDNGGLVLAIASRVPEDAKKQMEDTDKDHRALHLAAESTGVRERIESRFGSRGFFALSPAWINPAKQDKSAHKVMFWLNPYDQQNNNFGWFTVEQLDQWLEGKGPIPKKPKKNG